MSEDWTPCRFIDYREFLDEEDIVSRFGLIFDEFGSTQEFLESQGFMGGGYTWFLLTPREKGAHEVNVSYINADNETVKQTYKVEVTADEE